MACDSKVESRTGFQPVFTGKILALDIAWRPQSPRSKPLGTDSDTTSDTASICQRRTSDNQRIAEGFTHGFDLPEQLPICKHEFPINKLDTHARAAKRFKDGLPGSPGTRNIEHSLQFYHELRNRYAFSWHDIDRLASINPAQHVSQFFDFPLEIGTMTSGAMANLAIFDSEASYAVDESTLAIELEDPEYHSALTGEANLRGKSLFTVVNGRVYDVKSCIKALN